MRVPSCVVLRCAVLCCVVLCFAMLTPLFRYIFGLIGRIERPCMGLFGDPELKVGSQAGFSWCLSKSQSNNLPNSPLRLV